jgi:hypothetical protein
MKSPIAAQFSLAIAVFVGAVLALPPAEVRADPTREYAVKAAFIYNFAQFTQWPAEAFASPDAVFVIGLLGDDPFDGALDKAVAGKTVSGHPMMVKRVTNVAEAGGCAVLFIPVTQEGRVTDVLNAVMDKPVLTVGETDNFPWSGGVIRFLTEDNKVRFEINPEAAERAHLRISSKLMKLARIFKR